MWDGRSWEDLHIYLKDVGGRLLRVRWRHDSPEIWPSTVYQLLPAFILFFAVKAADGSTRQSGGYYRDDRVDYSKAAHQNIHRKLHNPRNADDIMTKARLCSAWLHVKLIRSHGSSGIVRAPEVILIAIHVRIVIVAGATISSAVEHGEAIVTRTGPILIGVHGAEVIDSC